MSGERRLWRVPVTYTDMMEGEDGESVQYVWASDRAEAEREATANVEEDRPGADVFADARRITEARIVNGKVQA